MRSRRLVVLLLSRRGSQKLISEGEEGLSLRVEFLSAIIKEKRSVCQ